LARNLKRHLTYANVMATLALFLSLGAGAYAVGLGRDSVKSRNIADGSVRPQDIKDQSITGRQIHDEILNSRDIREDRLDVNQFAQVDSDSRQCNPTGSTFVECASLNFVAEQESDIFIIGAGGQESEGGPATGRCEATVDGLAVDGSTTAPGETTASNSDLGAQNGYSITQVAPHIHRGNHHVAIECNEVDGDTRLTTMLSVLVLDAK
jgi:hypothetical protein